MGDQLLTDSYPFDASSDFPIELAMLIAICIELLLYGVYTCLFFNSFYIMLTQRRIQTRSRKVVLAAILSMYMVATFDNALNLYRLMQAFIWWRDPRSYFLSFNRWEYFANSLNYCVMVWLGDALVLYRCFIIWNQSYIVVILPSLLLTLSTVSDAVIMYWFSHPPNLSLARLVAWVDSIYVVNLVQNVLTTGLIVFKILHQHRVSAAAGARHTGSQLRLTHVVRILVESASLYTIQLLILIILHLRRHNSQFIVQYSIVPTIGIVFNLITVRTHMTELGAIQVATADPLTGLPSWADDHSGSASESDGTSSHPSFEESPPIRMKSIEVVRKSQPPQCV